MTMQSAIKEEKLLKLKGIQEDKKLYRVFFEDGSNYLCSEDDIFEYKLYKDALVSSAVISKIASKDSYYNCLNEALRLVNVKQYSIKQVSDKLASKNFLKEDINQVITYLEKIGILNDDLFYEAYVEFKVNQGYGPVYIKNKLFLLGIDRLVEINHQKQHQMVTKAFLIQNKGLDSKSVFVKKFRSKMVQQGFSLEVIDQVLNENTIKTSNQKLEREIKKLLSKYNGVIDEYQLKQKVINNLISKGYAYEEVEEILRKEVD